MARSGSTEFTPNQKFFDAVLRTAPVQRLVDAAAERALAAAKASAPVDTGAYRDSLHIEHRESRFRQVARVVSNDEKVMLIESKHGVLARAVKAAKQ